MRRARQVPWLGSHGTTLESQKLRRRRAQEPENIDKEFLRLWFKANCDPYNDPVLPEAPRELVAELSRRYIYLYETITGQRFEPADLAVEPNARMARSLKAAGM